MIKDASRGKFQLVLVHKMDRFARNVDDSRAYRKQLKKVGVRVRSTVENIDEDTQQGAMMLNMFDGISEFYSMNLSQETMKGLKENAYACIHTGGIPPYGFEVDSETKKLVINQHEAEGVKLIFKMFNEGFSYNEILSELNSTGYKSKKGQPFVVSSIYSILGNEKYTGTYIFNKSTSKDVDGKRNGHKYKDKIKWIIVENGYPQIINKDDFDLAQNKRQNRMSLRDASNVKETYLLKGKIVCCDCGGSYVGGRRRSGDKKSYYAGYKCNKRFNSKRSGCKNKEIQCDYLESAILGKIAECVFSDKNVKLVVSEYNEHRKKLDFKGESNEKNLKKELNSVIKEIDSAYELVLKSKAKVLLEKLDTLDERKQKLEARLVYVQSSKTPNVITENEVKEIFRIIREKLYSRELKNIRAIMQTFVNKVVIYHDKAEVFLNFFPNITLDFDQDKEEDG